MIIKNFGTFISLSSVKVQKSVTGSLVCCELQQCTGVDDLETCMAILEHHDWNLQVKTKFLLCVY